MSCASKITVKTISHNHTVSQITDFDDGVIDVLNSSVLNSNSANWNSVYSTVSSLSTIWGAGNNTIVEQNSACWNRGCDVYTTFNTVSANMQNIDVVVQTNSAQWAIDTSSDVSLIQSTSANWNSSYTTLNNNSANWLTQSLANSYYVNMSGDTMTGGLSAPSLSTDNLYVGASTIYFMNNNAIVETLNSANVTDFKSNYATVNSNSAQWAIDTTGDLTLIQATSANWQSNYSTVNSNSADWNYQGNDIKSLSANWESNYSAYNSASATNTIINTTVQNNSAQWAIDTSADLTLLQTTSANWQSDYSTTTSNSANWVNTYNTVTNTSGSWGGISITSSPSQIIFNNSGTLSGSNLFTISPSANVIISTANRLSASPLAITGAWLTAGGDASTTKPMFLIESPNIASNWSNLGTGLGINAPFGFTGDLINATISGNLVRKTFAVKDANLNFGSTTQPLGLINWIGVDRSASLSFGSNVVSCPSFKATGGTVSLYNSNETILHWYLTQDNLASNALQLGYNSSTPQNYLFKSNDGSGANITGANLTIAAGRGTGSGLGGSLTFSVASGLSASSSIGGNLTPRMTIRPNGLIDIAESSVVVTLSTYSAAPMSGLTLINPLSAASGLQRSSPSLNLVGQAFNTTTLASSAVGWRIFNLPIQGNPPQGSLILQDNQNNGTWTNALVMNSPSNTGGTWGTFYSNYGSFILSIGGGGATAINTSFTTNGSTLTVTANGGSINTLHAKGTNILQFGGSDSAIPVSQTLKAQDGTGSNITGGSLIIQAGRGTGQGKGGSLVFSTCSAASSVYFPGALATTTGTLVSAFNISPDSLITFAPYSNISLGKTITPAGTTGDRTIHRTSGTVNFATAAASLSVSNMFVTPNSVIQTTLGSNDASMYAAVVSAGINAFIIYPKPAAPAAETIVYFTVF